MIKPIFSVLDDAWKKEFSNNYTLSLLISKDAVGCCILDISKKKYLAIEWFAFQNSNSFVILKDKLNELLEQNEIFNFPYQHIHIGIAQTEVAIVPENLWDEKNGHDFLEFSHTVEPYDRIRTDDLPQLKSKNVYAMNSELLVMLQEHFENVTIHHSTTSLMEVLLKENRFYNDTRIFANIQQSRVELIVLEKGKLLLFNYFDFQTPEDFIFYILFTCQQLDLNPEILNFYFLGEIEKKSPLFDITYKYIRNVYFGRRPNTYSYSYKFAFFPSHFYYNMFSLNLVGN